MKYTRIAEDTFQKLQLNAGVLCVDFNPLSGEIKEDDILGATDGGVSFVATPTFRDDAEGVDNAPLNLKEFKKLDDVTCTLSGTFKSLDTRVAKILIGTGDSAVGNPSKITARVDLKDTDFTDIWWVGDYGNDGGYLALKVINALSTGGFQIQSANKDKGAFAFEFTGHRSILAQSVVPFEVYISSKDVTNKPRAIAFNAESAEIADEAKLLENQGASVTFTAAPAELEEHEATLTLTKTEAGIKIDGSIEFTTDETGLPAILEVTTLTFSGIDAMVGDGSTVSDVVITGKMDGKVEDDEIEFAVSNIAISGTKATKISVSDSSEGLTDASSLFDSEGDRATIESLPSEIKGGSCSITIAYEGEHAKASGEINIKCKADEVEEYKKIKTLTWNSLELAIGESGDTLTGVTLNGALDGEINSLVFTVSGGTLTGTKSE